MTFKPKPLLGSRINPHHPLSRGLVGCWDFNELTGDIVFDLSNDRRHGSVQSTPVWTPDGLSFDASAEYVDCGLLDMGGWTEFTAIVSYKIRDLTTGVMPFGNEEWDAGSFFINHTDIDGVRVYIFTTSGYENTTPVYTYPEGDYVVAATYKSGDVNLYIDGVHRINDATFGTALDPDDSLNPLRMAVIAAFATNTFDGIIKYARMYDRALTPSEVMQSYIDPCCFYQPQPPSPIELTYSRSVDVARPRSPKPLLGRQVDPHHPLSKGLIGCWNFNERVGDTVFDLSNDRRHGTINASPIWTPEGLDVATPIEYVDCGSLNMGGWTEFSAIVSYSIRSFPGNYPQALVMDNRGGSNAWFYVLHNDGGPAGSVSGRCYTTSQENTGTFNADVPGDYVATLTYKDGDFRLYVDGVLRNSKSIGTVLGSGDSTAPLRFGTSDFWPDDPLDGVLKYARMYDRALTPSEVMQSYIDPHCFLQSELPLEALSTPNVYSAIILDDDYWDGTESWAGEVSQVDRDAKYGTRRFTSINAWEIDRDGNSSSGTIEHGIISGPWASEDTAQVIMGGWNADGVVIDCPLTLPDGPNPARHNGIYGGVTNAYRLVGSNDNPGVLVLDNDNVVVRGIQVFYTCNSSNQKGILARGITNFDILVEDCVVKGDPNNTWDYNSGIVAYATTSSGVLTVKNCVITDCQDNADNTGAIQCWAGTGSYTINVYNTTVYNCRVGIWSETDNSTVNAKNCAVFNCNDDFKVGLGTLNVDYCASDDGDGTNEVDWTAEATDWAANFNDYANDNFTPLDQDLPGAGVGPATDANVPTTDILGNPRSGTTCTIGALQNVSKLSDGEDLSGTFIDDIQARIRSIWYIGASELVPPSFIGMVGNLWRAYTGQRSQAGDVGSDGALARKFTAARMIEGLWSGGGALARKFTGSRLIEGPWSGAGALARKFTAGRQVLGSIVSAGALNRIATFPRLLAGILSSPGALLRKFTGARQLAGDFSFSTAFSRIVTFPRKLVGVMSGAGSLIRKFTGGRLVAGTFVGPPLAGTNFDFESYTGTQDDGTNDTFTGWVGFAPGLSKIEATATVQSGSNAVKLQAAFPTNFPSVYADIEALLEVGKTYRIIFWTRGDGASAEFEWYLGGDIGGNIIAPSNTNVTGTTYTKITTEFTYSQSNNWVRLYFTNWHQTGFAYLDNVEIRSVTFGSGALMRKFIGARQTAGDLGFTGVVDWAYALFQRAVAGVVAFGGSLARIVTYKRQQDGQTDAPAGALSRIVTFPRSIAGATGSLLGALARKLTAARQLAGDFSFASAFSRIVTFPRKIAGALTFSGTVTRSGTLGRTILGVLSSTGVVNRKGTLYRALDGVLSFSGTVEWSIDLLKRAVAGVVGWGATLTRVVTFKRQQDGDFDETGSLVRKFIGSRMPEGELGLIYTLKDTQGQATNWSHYVAAAEQGAYVAGSFVAGSSYKIRKIILRLSDVFMSASGITYTVEIRNHDGTDPTTVLPNGSSSIIGVSGAEAEYEIYFNPGCDVIDSNKYAVVMHRGGTWDALNNIAWHYKDTGSELCQRDPTDEAPWITADDSCESAIITYESPGLVGILARKFTGARQLVGTVSFSGVLDRVVTFIRALTGEVTWSGVVDWSVEFVQKAVAGVLAFGATLTRIVTFKRPQEGDLTATGTVARSSGVFSRIVLGALTKTGIVNRKSTLYRALSADLSFSGAVDWTIDLISEAVAGVLAFGATLTRVVTFKRQPEGELDTAGTVTRAGTLSRAISGALTSVGAVIRKGTIYRAISGALESGGRFTPLDMTSNNSSGYVASESSYFGSQPAWRAFDASDGTPALWIGTNGGVDWIKIDIGAGNEVICSDYTVRTQVEATYGGPRAIKDWKLQGSNNDSDWDDLHTVTGETGWNDGETRAFTCDVATTAYRYFRVNITDNNGDPTYTSIATLKLNELGWLSGTVSRKVTFVRGLVGEVSFSGTVDWALDLITRAVAGVQSFGATLTRVVTFKRPQEGELDTAGTVSRKGTLYRALSADITFSGTVEWSIGLITRAVAGVVGFGATLTRKLTLKRQPEGELDTSGTVVRSSGIFGRSVLGALTFTGIVDRKGTLYRALAGDVTWSGTVEWAVGLITRAVAGVVGFGATLTRVVTFKRQQEGSIDSSGTVTRAGILGRAVLGVLAATGIVNRQSTLYRALAGNVTFSSILRRIQIGLAIITCVEIALKKWAIEYSLKTRAMEFLLKERDIEIGAQHDDCE